MVPGKGGGNGGGLQSPAIDSNWGGGDGDGDLQQQQAQLRERIIGRRGKTLTARKSTGGYLQFVQNTQVQNVEGNKVEIQHHPGVPHSQLPTATDSGLLLLQGLADISSVQYSFKAPTVGIPQQQGVWNSQIPAAGDRNTGLDIQQQQRQSQLQLPGGIGSLGGIRKQGNYNNYDYSNLGFGLPGRRPPPSTSTFGPPRMSPRLPDYLREQIESITSSISPTNMQHGYPLPLDFVNPGSLPPQQSRFDYRRLSAVEPSLPATSPQHTVPLLGVGGSIGRRDLSLSANALGLQIRPQLNQQQQDSRTNVLSATYSSNRKLPVDNPNLEAIHGPYTVTVASAIADASSQNSKQGKGILQWSQPRETNQHQPGPERRHGNDIIQLSSSDEEALERSPSRSRQDPIEEPQSVGSEAEQSDAAKEEPSSDDGSESSVYYQLEGKYFLQLFHQSANQGKMIDTPLEECEPADLPTLMETEPEIQLGGDVDLSVGHCLEKGASEAIIATPTPITDHDLIAGTDDVLPISTLNDVPPLPSISTLNAGTDTVPPLPSISTLNDVPPLPSISTLNAGTDTVPPLPPISTLNAGTDDVPTISLNAGDDAVPPFSTFFNAGHVPPISTLNARTDDVPTISTFNAGTDAAPPISTLNAGTDDEKFCIQKRLPAEFCGNDEEEEEKLEMNLPKAAVTEIKIETEPMETDVDRDPVEGEEEEEKFLVDAKLEIPEGDPVAVQADENGLSSQNEVHEHIPVPGELHFGSSTGCSSLDGFQEMTILEALKLKIIEGKFLQNENGAGPSLLHTYLVQNFDTGRMTDLLKSSKLMIIGPQKLTSPVEMCLINDFDLKRNIAVKSFEEFKKTPKASLSQFKYFIHLMDCDVDFDMNRAVHDFTWLSCLIPKEKVDVLLWRSSKNTNFNYPSVSQLGCLTKSTGLFITPIFHDQPRSFKKRLEYCRNRFQREIRLQESASTENK